MNRNSLVIATVAVVGALGASTVVRAHAEDAGACFQCGEDRDGYGNTVHSDYWDGINSYHGLPMHTGMFGGCHQWHVAYAQ
jgi:hypothetical protein